VNSIELGYSHVRDLLDNVIPVHAIDPLAARDAAQQIGLGFRPSQDIGFVETVWRGLMLL
jgi:hypothetical protein